MDDSSSFARVKRTIVAAAAVYSAGWLGYYAYQETRRRSEIRKRKRRHQGGPKTLEADRARFASLRIAGRYQNPYSEWRETGAWEWAIHKLSQPLMGHTYPFFHMKQRVIKSLEVEQPDLKAIERHPEALAATWFGQSTVLLQIDGLRILLDPVFVDQLAPPFGPRRQNRLPTRLAELGKIDVVVISHAHFDHLDFNVVEELGDSAKWIVPKGQLKRDFMRRGVTRVTELDWWQDTVLKYDSGAELRITGLPTMHWSARTPFDVNQTLWNSFVIQGTKTVFHCGDTGLCLDLFEAIGRHFDIDVAFLPIGSYSPRWYMSIQHVNPDDAVQIHRALGSKRTIAYHWGSFTMSDEPLDQPPIDLARALQHHQIDPAVFTCEPLGRTLIL